MSAAKKSGSKKTAAKKRPTTNQTSKSARQNVRSATQTKTTSAQNKGLFSNVWSGIKRERDVIPVIIFAIIPALSFWGGKNVSEIAFELMLRTFVVAIITAIIYYVVLYYLLGRDKYKASILAIVAIIFSYSYRFLYEYYDNAVTSWFGATTRWQMHRYFIWLLVVIFIGIFFFVKGRLKFSKTIRNYLALVAVISLAFNTYPIIQQWIKANEQKGVVFGSAVQTDPNAKRPERPDIYYFVFDRYANKQVLQEKYNFDNSPFLDGLKQRGFYTTEKTIANYPGTSMSLSSSLNLDYLPSGMSQKVGNSSTILHGAIENNRVVEFLKKDGYQFINVGPWWNATKYNHHADKNLYAPTGVVVAGKTIDLKQHELLMMQDTIFWHYTNRIKLFGRNLVKRTYDSNDTASRSTHRQAILHQFNTLNNIGNEKGPKFIFSHILLPHDPYVLDENCKFLPKSAVAPGYKNEYELYIKQVRCANTKIHETIDSILASSKTKPIIIVQADEGPYPMEYKLNRELEWDMQPTDILRQKAGILNSYYFPDGNYDKLYPSITPVNTFRVIFNQYHGTNLPLLEDKNFFPGSRVSSERFDFIDVTDKLKVE